MAWTTVPAFHLLPPLFALHKPTAPPCFFSNPSSALQHTRLSPTLRLPFQPSSSSFGNQICRAAEYKFPDPIPEFAVAETEKFRAHLLTKLSKKDIYGDSVQEVVGVCTEIFNTFMHTEYGGPGTLLVLPFIDMSDTINERGLPGGPQAARAAVKWAQEHVDKDWNLWTGDDGT
ncbi:Protein PLASTID REDOX INSENSITIVE 2 [Cucurbita argyrosperma subsp. argyrosperma]|uniref:Protein PLASTID REDOX INSENSITIVE 2, chloroplastic-like n=2 Tax=Cucurbita TaxID=3660 RepID=A0A6J1GWZ9_CUCMO|nr:protein PLASTID REDOX INSENSITIVE 2, chloroplastic-like [Cucurbita moschata]XP_022956597.1 protein PLASTID REDOX INSENSITIVE 2, chloroplastic-like [Cucurbita moschata]KAG7032158.1 Protein PLASTID REDOX INSENSITIVE 2 [Cucurbita argyrosperma subsp. argyrosperma]